VLTSSPSPSPSYSYISPFFSTASASHPQAHAKCLCGEERPSPRPIRDSVVDPDAEAGVCSRRSGLLQLSVLHLKPLPSHLVSTDSPVNQPNPNRLIKLQVCSPSCIHSSIFTYLIHLLMLMLLFTISKLWRGVLPTLLYLFYIYLYLQSYSCSRSLLVNHSVLPILTYPKISSHSLLENIGRQGARPGN
jgi:hypothetical protein